MDKEEREGLSCHFVLNMTKNDGNFLILSSNDWNAIWVTSQEDNAKIVYLQTFHEKNVEIFSIIILK